MNANDLFGEIPQDQQAQAKADMPSPPPGEARLIRAERHQIRLMPTDLDSLLRQDHPARAIWGLVERLDLSKFEEEIAARGEHPGRPAIDPKILVSLWLYATSEGVGAAREVERLCEAHHAYLWICGGVHVNHHTLSDFRVGHQEALDELMTQVLGVLKHQGLVDLNRVAQDGMRVRASAGAASFRRQKSLKRCLREAREQVKELAREVHAMSGTSARRQKAREGAAKDRVERLEEALKELPKVREGKKARDKPGARVSTTDPQARVMKMGDGGFRPAYNVQFAADTKTRVIVGVGVTNSGSDHAQMPPMLQNIRKRTGEVPKEYLVDGGFAKIGSIEEVAREGVTVYAPLRKPSKKGVNPHEPKPGDSAEVVEWRQRMATPEAKEIYKERAATIETVNGDVRNWRGLNAFRVRTMPKVQCVVLWAALTYNILRLFAGT